MADDTGWMQSVLSGELLLHVVEGRNFGVAATTRFGTAKAQRTMALRVTRRGDKACVTTPKLVDVAERRVPFNAKLLFSSPPDFNLEKERLEFELLDKSEGPHDEVTLARAHVAISSLIHVPSGQTHTIELLVLPATVLLSRHSSTVSLPPPLRLPKDASPGIKFVIYPNFPTAGPVPSPRRQSIPPPTSPGKLSPRKRPPGPPQAAPAVPNNSSDSTQYTHTAHNNTRVNHNNVTTSSSGGGGVHAGLRTPPASGREAVPEISVAQPPESGGGGGGGGAARAKKQRRHRSSEKRARQPTSPASDPSSRLRTLHVAVLEGSALGSDDAVSKVVAVVKGSFRETKPWTGRKPAWDERFAFELPPGKRGDEHLANTYLHLRLCTLGPGGPESWVVDGSVDVELGHLAERAAHGAREAAGSRRGKSQGRVDAKASRWQGGVRAASAGRGRGDAVFERWLALDASRKSRLVSSGEARPSVQTAVSDDSMHWIKVRIWFSAAGAASPGRWLPAKFFSSPHREPSPAPRAPVLRNNLCEAPFFSFGASVWDEAPPPHTAAPWPEYPAGPAHAAERGYPVRLSPPRPVPQRQPVARAAVADRGRAAPVADRGHAAPVADRGHAHSRLLSQSPHQVIATWLNGVGLSEAEVHTVVTAFARSKVYELAQVLALTDDELAHMDLALGTRKKISAAL
eukprot:gene18422-28423_t